MKKGFGYPLTLEALRQLCHPGEGHWSQPFRSPDGQAVYTCNGWLLVRVDTWVEEFEELEGARGQLPWILKHPWHRVEGEREEFFQPMEGHTGGLWKGGTQWPTHQRAPGNRWLVRTLRPVGVGPEFVTSQALLQLVSLLPGVRVHIRTPHGEPMPIRFRGGAALLRPFCWETLEKRVAAPRWRIYAGRKESFER